MAQQTQAPDTLSLRDRILLSADWANVPRDVALRLFYAESNMNPNAPAGDNGLSFGIGQVSEPVGKRYGLNVHDLSQNIMAALRYLREGYVRTGNWGLAYADYRAGLGASQRAGYGRPPGVEQASMDFVSGVADTVWNGNTVGRNGVPTQGESIKLSTGGLDIGNPYTKLPDPSDAAITVPDIPGAVQKGIQEALTNLSKYIADGLNEAGIRTTNQIANFWNRESPTMLFWIIAIGAIVAAIYLLQRQTGTPIVIGGASPRRIAPVPEKRGHHWAVSPRFDVSGEWGGPKTPRPAGEKPTAGQRAKRLLPHDVRVRPGISAEWKAD